jgi:starch synthase
MFLMPSRYEPCGMNQIFSLRYGAVPIVRATGGLDDTIQDYVPRLNGSVEATGNGFKFAAFSGAALFDTVSRALAVFADQVEWRKLMRNGMKQDHSWNSSAREYVGLYKELVEKNGPPDLKPARTPSAKATGIRAVRVPSVSLTRGKAPGRKKKA